MNKVITISREFGSGGRELGRRLSELLHIAYYDQEILTEIAKRTDLAESYIEQVVEQTPMMSFPIHIGRSFYPMMNPALELTQAVMVEQHKTIFKMARKIRKNDLLTVLFIHVFANNHFNSSLVEMGKASARYTPKPRLLWVSYCG